MDNNPKLDVSLSEKELNTAYPVRPFPITQRARRYQDSDLGSLLLKAIENGIMNKTRAARRR